MTSLGLDALGSADFGIGYFFFLLRLGPKADKQRMFCIGVIYRAMQPPQLGWGKVVENIFLWSFSYI